MIMEYLAVAFIADPENKSGNDDHPSKPAQHQNEYGMRHQHIHYSMGFRG